MKRRQQESPVDRDEAAAMWCMTLADGDLNEAERAAFDAWIADPENSEAMQLQAAGWNLVTYSAGAPEIVRMRSAALQDYRAASADRWRERKGFLFRRRHGLAIAAAVLLALGPFAAWQVGMFGGAASGDVVVSELKAPHGERQLTSLADGSHVTLDAASVVDVRMSSTSRDIALVSGRATFAVVKSPRPFKVAAGDKVVIATGTRFSVERLQDKVEVILYEGSVRVVGPDDRLITAMDPGQAVTMPAFGESDSVSLRKTPPGSQSWEYGELEFVDDPLPDAVARINRYAASPVILARDVPSSLRVTGVFDAKDSRGFAYGVASLNGLRVNETPAGLIIASD